MEREVEMPLRWPGALGLACVAIAGFHLAQLGGAWGLLVFAFVLGLLELTCLPTPRVAFYIGLLVGIGCYAPQLRFFWTIFGIPAVVLWVILSFWIALFLSLGRCVRSALPPGLAVPALALLWLALEYFRSEGYYLRFTWLTIGSALSQVLSDLMPWLGVYGVGFVAMLLGSGLIFLKGRPRIVHTTILLCLLGAGALLLRISPIKNATQLRVAGVQIEFPSENQIIFALDKLFKEHPSTDLFVLSEYSLDGPIPPKIKRWCQSHHKYLLLGGKDPAGENYYNTAFVVGPGGDIVFRQVKSVPIQFFKDGLPAKTQSVWDSPWGKIGICICYDLSYRTVVDELARQGAQALIVPTMDVEEWGEYQHRLHARIGPIRAREFRIPVLRVCSSGISQLLTGEGVLQASAPFPGQDETLHGMMTLARAARIPADHWVGPTAVLLAPGILLIAFLRHRRRRQRR